MAAGVDAVKAQLERDFGEIKIEEEFDLNTQEVILNFEAQRNEYGVRISREFDDDYASGQNGLDLSVLGATLRDSKSGRARVMRTAISSN